MWVANLDAAERLGHFLSCFCGKIERMGKETSKNWLSPRQKNGGG